jgi:hypothetical protein
MGAMRNPIDPMLKRRLEKELATQQALDEKAHLHKAKQQHANLVRSVQEQCDKARARLSAETDRVMAELTKDMEGQFEMLRLRFEAKQNHLHQVICPFPRTRLQSRAFGTEFAHLGHNCPTLLRLQGDRQSPPCVLSRLMPAFRPLT